MEEIIKDQCAANPVSKKQQNILWFHGAPIFIVDS